MLTFIRAREHVGAPVLGPYFETFWLPVAGPTAMVLQRHLVRNLPPGPDDAYIVDAEHLAPAMGVSVKVLMRTLDRMVRLRCVIERDEPASWDVRTTVRPLSPSQVERLPVPLRGLHDLVVANSLGAVAAEA